MKSVHKALLAITVACSTGLSVWSAAAMRLDVAPPQAPSEPEKAQQQGTKAEDPLVKEEPAARVAEIAQPVIDSEPASAPADFKITSRETKTGRVWKLRRQGHVVAVRRNGAITIGMHEVNIPAAAGEEVVWETTSEKSLLTLRGRALLPESGAPEQKNVQKLLAQSVDKQTGHECQGFGDGAGGFFAVCRVETGAAAASVDGADPQKGVWSQAGESSALVRLDLPMSGDGASSKVIGYEKGGRGVLIRAEASRVPGEESALFALGSAGRAQPRPPRRIGCFCRLPPPGDIL